MPTSRPLPAPPPSFGRASAIMAAVLSGGLAVVLVVAATTAVLAGASSPAGSPTPEVAVEDYFTADETDDCSVLVQHPISGYEDRQDCEAGVADRRDELEDDDVDPDSRAHDIEFVENVSHDSEDEAVVTINVTFERERDGETEYLGGIQGYAVERDDDGSWVVREFVYED